MTNSEGFTSEHLAWMLNTVRELQREWLPASAIQRRMDDKFPANEHQALWVKLLKTVGAR
jgi:hypothetical protein